MLDVSFRSAAPVLALVDAVFADPLAAAGVVPERETLRHEPHRAGHAGRVELWPLAPLPPHDAPQPWAIAERNLGLVTAPQRLADALAHWIAAQIGAADCSQPRAARCEAGDVLVLVRRRDDFARALVRRLKGWACRSPGSTGCTSPTSRRCRTCWRCATRCCCRTTTSRWPAC